MRHPTPRRLAVTAALCIVLPSGAATAQDMPKADYYRYLPLEVPRLVRQTQASSDVDLYGNRADPDYVDAAPRDGIDDRRYAVLQQLALRFAPFMVMNSTAVPMDFRRLSPVDIETLHIDIWNTVAEGGVLVREETLNLRATAGDPCTAAELAVRSAKDDCRLRELLAHYDPDTPTSALTRARAIDPAEELFDVLYLDFPGHDEASWRAAFSDKTTGQLPSQYRGALRSFVHPFVNETPGSGGERGFELILQYWFFYPWNDGGNNHKGDWEHINVAISPLHAVTRPLTAEELQRVLGGGGLSGEPRDAQLVIKRVEYYFHHQVFTLDYSTPNVYLPRAEWHARMEAMAKERASQNWLFGRIRWRAYQDEAEEQINTHPVVHIGADNKGFDQLLAMPGGKNRDSHGSFPFRGLYKDVGPGGAAEEIRTFFDHRAFFAAAPAKQAALLDRWERGAVVWLQAREALELIPDWERVIDLVRSDATVRQQWAWMVLPVRFGYPASVSPFAGIVAHAETGNLAILGPAFSTGWNRTGAVAGFSDYAPHKIPRIFPIGVQDRFHNSWGFFNVIALAAVLPPIDVIWPIPSAVASAVTRRQDPTFYPQDRLPARFLGLGAGVSRMRIPTDFLDLAINDPQFDEVLGSILDYILANGDSTSQVIDEGEIMDVASAPYGTLTFFLGSRFASENMLRHSRSAVGLRIQFDNIDQPYALDGDVNLWEYAGSLRYNLTTGNLQLYPKAGYGVSRYRLEGLGAAAQPLPTPDTRWVTKWTWHAGGGLELITIKSYAPPPQGVDLSLRGEWTVYSHNLGLDLADLPLETLVLLGRGANDLPRDRRVTRSEWKLGVTVSF